MLWGQDIKVYTDHKNLTRDALGLTSDRVYHWRLLLEEYAQKIKYIEGTHNTVGVVHAYVGQKLLKPYILRVFWLTDYKLFHATFD